MMNKEQSSHRSIRPFLVVYNNRIKRGAHPLAIHTAEGVQFTSKRVIIDTEYFGQQGFETMKDMHEAMERYGDCNVFFLNERENERQNELRALSPLARKVLHYVLREAFDSSQIQVIVSSLIHRQRPDILAELTYLCEALMPAREKASQETGKQ